MKCGRPLRQNGLTLKPDGSENSTAQSKLVRTSNKRGKPSLMSRPEVEAYEGRGPSSEVALFGALEDPGAENSCDE